METKGVVRIEVPGVPVGKARPRFTRTGRCYNTKKTKEFETRVARAFLNSGATQFRESEALKIDIIAEMPIPKSATKKVLRAIEEGTVKHLKKPDLDNIVKAVLDGLNGIAFPDDKQVIMLSAFKRYSKDPKTIICIFGGDHGEERFAENQNS